MPLEAFQTALYESRSKLEIARDYIHLVDKPHPTDADTLKDIRKIAADLMTLVQERLTTESSN
jgi:hypothetical protein